MTDTLRCSQHLLLPPFALSSLKNAHKPYLKCFEVAPTPTATATAARRCLRDGREATYVACPLSVVRCPLDTIGADAERTGFHGAQLQQLLDTCPVLIAAINE